MKTLLCLLALTASALSMEPVVTQASLPEDRLIFPVPEKAEGIEVTARFKSDVVISSVTQGNWIRLQREVTYTVVSAPADFPLKEFRFICQDSDVTLESGIRLRKVVWPFREGTMKFTLQRDDSVRYTPYFKIVRYEALEETK